MDEATVSDWFDLYLNTLAARGRGESEDLKPLLEFYAVPLVVATDDASHALTTAEGVTDFARQQVEGMQAAHYHRTEIIEARVTVLNVTSALYRGAFARQRLDGGEIGRLGVTYLITDGTAGLRISALAVHSP
jgi:hypothetical protein